MYMAVKGKQNTYKMLQLYAKDIYNYTRFDENGIKNKNNKQTPYAIDVIYKDKEENEKLSPLFRASMGDNLDLFELENIIRKEKGIEPRKNGESLGYAIKTIKLKSKDKKEVKYNQIISNFISVTFDGASHAYEKVYNDYDNNWRIFVKKGIEQKFKFEDFNKSDSVIKNEGKVIGVRTNFEIKQELDLEKYGFTNKEMYDKNKKCYKYEQYKSDLYVLKDAHKSYDYNYFEDRLDDGIYVEKNEIIAIKTNFKVSNPNEIVKKSNYFEYNTRSKVYKFKNTTSNDSDKYENLGPSFVEYESNKPQIYVKRGLRMRYDELVKKLVDSVYIENNELLAIKTSTLIENKNKIVCDSRFFKYDEEYNCYRANDSMLNNNSHSKVSADLLRHDLYENGFYINIFNKKVKYVRYKRSASNARSGNCIFINEKYYETMKNWTYLGPEFAMDYKANKEMPVELEAYKSLSLSTLIDTIELDPYSILILKDKDSIFKEKCVGVKIENESLTAEEKKLEIKNSIWDGEGLLDESVFNDNGYEDKGMLLLRNRYFKCCAFNTKLQAWFKANEINDISQLNGYVYSDQYNNLFGGEHRDISINDIKLVITESSLKFIKFRSFDNEFNTRIVINYWKNKVGNTFGVVKTDKPTKYFNGNVTRTSYQSLNTIGMTEDDINDLSSQTYNYLKLIRNKPEVLKYYLKCQLNVDDENVEDKEAIENIDTSFLNFKNKLVYELLCLNTQFMKSKLFTNEKKTIVENYKKEFHKGRIFVRGTFSTLFGNGYELLHSTINPKYLIKDKDYDIDNIESLKLKKGEVMCKRFNADDDICCIRYPHITMGNLYKAKNVFVEEYDKWFNLTPEIACVNSIGENIQNRLNGMDYDGDTMMITNYKPIVDATKKYYNEFGVPVYEKQEGDLGIKNVAEKKLFEIDHIISNNQVGNITNLSQWLNSIFWDIYNEKKTFDKDLYYNICKLAILCGMEIDKAKRNYKVNAKNVMDSITEEIVEKYKNKPKFMGKISKNKNKYANIDMDTYAEYNTTMGYIDRYKFDEINSDDSSKGKDLIYFFNMDKKKSISGTYKDKANRLIALLQETVGEIDKINKEDKKEIIRKTYEVLDNFSNTAIKDKLVTHPYTVELALKENIDDRIQWVLLYILYKTETNEPNYKNMLQLLFENKDNQKSLVENPNGNIELFGIKYEII